MVAIAISRDRIDMIHWLTFRLHTAFEVSAGWNKQGRNRTALNFSGCTHLSSMTGRQCIRFVAVQTSKRATMRRLPTNTPHGHIYLSTVCPRHSYALVFQWNHHVYTRNQKETGTLLHSHTHTPTLKPKSFLPCCLASGGNRPTCGQLF